MKAERRSPPKLEIVFRILENPVVDLHRSRQAVGLSIA
jgi:hypothetical protein